MNPLPSLPLRILGNARSWTHCISAAAVLLIANGCADTEESTAEGLSIAFLADVHIHDVYADFTDSEAVLLRHPETDRPVTIHTMERQLSISRLENENYFAFLAALDDVIARGIRHVVLPGDFTSEGKMMNVRKVQRILREYTDEHGLRFYLISGNHDPRYPYLGDGGWTHFLGEEGRRQPVMSKEGLHTPADETEWPVAITRDIQSAGYHEIVDLLEDYGYYPRETDYYWETPFSDYCVETYSFQGAQASADLSNRTYVIEPHSMTVPDVSYLVEPVEGLWLLAIDANVYVPRDEVTENYRDAANYLQAGGAGFNAVVEHKSFLVDWVASVAERARNKDKVLVAYSHYPLIEYASGAIPEIRSVLSRPQLATVPSRETSRLFADTGIRLHFGGHVHNNGTTVMHTEQGNVLVDIQVPSTAGYVPAYKILTVHSADRMEIETVVLDDVPRLNEFFDLYRMEHGFLRESSADRVWDSGILASADYRELAEWHLRELVFRYRHFPQRWPDDLAALLREVSGEDLLIFAHIEDARFEILGSDGAVRQNLSETAGWRHAKERARESAETHGVSPGAFADWNGMDLVFDYYRLLNAGELAFSDIGEARMRQYRLLNEWYGATGSSPYASRSELRRKVGRLFGIIVRFLDGEPSDHFMIDLKEGKITRESRVAR